MKLKFAKYLKEIGRQSFYEQLSIKYFLNIAFLRGISPKLSSSFDCYKGEWVNPFTLRAAKTGQTILAISF